MGYLRWLQCVCQRLNSSKQVFWATFAASAAFCAWCCTVLFEFGAPMVKASAPLPRDAPWWLRYHLKLAFSVEQHNSMLSQCLPYALAIGFIGLVVTCLNYIDDSISSGHVLARLSRGAWSMITSCVALAVFCCTLSTFTSIDPSVANIIPTWAQDIASTARAHNLMVSSSYGLFRRMTGVGPSVKDQWYVFECDVVVYSVPSVVACDVRWLLSESAGAHQCQLLRAQRLCWKACGKNPMATHTSGMRLSLGESSVP